MKKIISFILTLAMVMSLSSVPVFAAEITSTDEGSNSASQSVTATYIPEAEKAAITGVSVTVDGKTYNSGETVTLTPNSGSVTITVSGSNLTNLNADNNKLLYADGSSVGVSQASGWTVDDADNASKTFELSTFQSCTTAFEIKYSNEGDVSDKYKGSGIYIVYQNETVSVGITWGAMNFTYSDEKVDGSDKGWTCETGANTVKVENNGTVNVTAGISYTAESNYSSITGTFDKNSETIGTGDSATFTLTLSGKPDAKLSGATIGTVTVTIAKVDVNATSMSADELKTALADVLAAGKTDIYLTLASDASDAMFTAICNAISASNATNGSINLTLLGVTTIPNSAFEKNAYFDMNKLKTINLPNVTTIGDNAFYGCKYLISVTAPNVTVVGEEAFTNCNKLTEISLPKCEKVGYSAFVSCEGLTNVELPAATSIDWYAFQGCSSLVSIKLPKVTTVGNYAFDACTKLTSITFGTPVTKWGGRVFGYESAYYKVDTENLTLTFATGQKTFGGDSDNGWTATETDLTADTNVEFCGRTFKSITFAN